MRVFPPFSLLCLTPIIPAACAADLQFSFAWK